MQDKEKSTSINAFYGSDAHRANDIYRLGKTMSYFCPKDKRFTYRLYVPSQLSQSSAKNCTICVAIHGSLRTPERKVDTWREFAEYMNCLILAPLFTGNVFDDGNNNGYKYIKEKDIRYDQLVINMVNQVAADYGVNGDKFFMTGFSGGGQFCNRFMYLHPEKLKGISIGAPGSVTLLNDTDTWWVGVNGMKKEFGIELNLDNLKKVPIHLVVGEADIATWENTIRDSNPYYQEGCNKAGKTRIDRLRALRDSLQQHGLNVHYEEAAEASHDYLACASKSKFFFANLLNNSKPTSTG